jgi:outer membrane protein
MTGRNHDLRANDFSQSWMTANNYLGGISLSQFLFDFGRRHGFVTERKFEAAAAEERARLTDLDLIFEVSRRYFALLEAKQLVRVYQKALEQRRYHLREAQVKAKVGLRPELDVYVTEEQVQRAQLHLVEADNAVADAKVALDNAMGLSEAAPDYQLADVLTASEIKDAKADLLRTAFKLRPDLKMLTDEAKALGAQVVEYRSDYFPTANLAAGYATMGTGLPATNNINAGLVIVWPIFNGYLTSHQIEEAKLKQQAVRDAFDDLRQNVIQEVSTTFLNWQASRVKIQRAEKVLAAARVELELADKRYAAGLSDIIELEDAERRYTADDAGYADALYGFSVAEAAVDRATARRLGRR